MKNKLLFTLVTLFALIVNAHAQEKTVTGTVTDAGDGSPIPGVNVIIKGSSQGTSTDINGKYTISIDNEATVLQYTFVGYIQQEVTVGNQSKIDVALEPNVKQLSEVVVTAIGIEREKKALGYSVTTVDSDKLQQKSEADPVRALQGKVAGVNIVGVGGVAGGGTNINIRGNSSLLGNNQVLFVVDGVPFDNSTNPVQNFTNGGSNATTTRSFDLDPNNIETLTVLKGAAASALYGSRASNGVIVITTKAGSGKATRKGLEVAVSTGYSIEEVANTPDIQKRYTQGNNFSYVDGNYGTWGAPFDLSDPAWEVPDNKNLIKSIDPATGKAWVSHPYDQYNDADAVPYFPEYVGDSVLLQAYDAPNQFLRRGYLLTNSVSISSGGEKGNISATLSRTKNEGITPGNEVIRYNGALGANAKLNNGLYVGGNINYVYSNSVAPPTAGIGTSGLSVYQRLLFLPPNVTLDLPTEDSQGNPAFYRSDNDHPFYLAEHSKFVNETNRVYGNLKAHIDIIKDVLNVKYTLGTNYYIENQFGNVPKGSFNGSIGGFYDSKRSNLELDGNLIFRFNKKLMTDLGLVALVGHNWNSRTVNWTVTNYTDQVARGLIVPSNYNEAQAGLNIRSVRTYQAAYVDLSLDYKDFIYLNFTGRNDWTSTLPKDNRSYFYGGVSSSFIFTEAFKQLENNILNFGKVRVGYARTGSDNNPYQTILNTFPISQPYNGNSRQTISNRLGDPSLVPEFTTELEIGGEARLWNNRISIDFTYYDRLTTNQIIPISVPRSIGYVTRVTNLGKVSNKGVELAINADVLKKGDFNLNIFATYTDNDNIVEEIGEGIEQIQSAGYTNIGNVHRVGKPFSQIIGSTAARHTDGRLLVDPSTGKLFEDKDDIIGDPNPEYFWDFGFNATYKGIGLNVIFNYKKGGDVYSTTYAQTYGRGVTTGTIPDGPRGRAITVVIPGVEGDPTTKTAILKDGQPVVNGTQLTVNDWYFRDTFAAGGFREFSVFDATTIRLREVSLSYRLPKKLLSRTPFGSASISFSGRNLWYKAVNFPDDLNFDPETNSIGVGNSQGIDFGIVPTTKRYGVNLKFTF